MKLQLVLATALLAISATSVQAADTRMPDILASVSSGSAQVLSKNEAAKTRGEYINCYASGYCLEAELSVYLGEDYYGWMHVDTIKRNGRFYYISR